MVVYLEEVAATDELDAAKRLLPVGLTLRIADSSRYVLQLIEQIRSDLDVCTTRAKNR
jgi:hypothetical protein